jgi:hypothetical protein
VTGGALANPEVDQHRWRERVVAAAAVALPLIVLFGPALFTDRSFAMRDAGHYYYPLFKWCADEWGAGRMPLVSPLQAGGIAMCADPTASIWYPGKLVFALPLDFAVNCKLYVLGHVALCAIAAYWLARRWCGSRSSAAVAALSYACGGSVVFQHANIVYLVGAAWLPVAAGLVDDIFRSQRLGSAIWLAVVLALMVLGGDPQMAYHALLLVTVYTVVLFSSRLPATELQRSARRGAVVGGGLAIAVAALAFSLAAIQILPSAQATRDSDRAQYDQPRNLYESASHLLSQVHSKPAVERLQDVRAGLFSPPSADSHHALAYDYSVAPWRLVEFIWPNIGGRMFPAHRRWFSLLSEESRIWTPTLYMGLLPLVLALGVCRLRSEDLRIRWLSWTALVFVLGSLGTFGIGWLVRHALAFTTGTTSPIGDGVGGVYWLFVVLLPKYVLFRYPAKLTIVAALCISQLAAVGWDRVLAAPPKRLIRLLTILGVLSGTSALGALIAALFIVLGARSSDPVFGPFDSRGAWTDIVTALSHTSAVSLASAWLLTRSTLGWTRWLLLLLCAAELALANHWLVPTAPTELWRQPSPIAAAIDGHGPRPQLFRTKLPWPEEFGTTISPRRLEELVVWERATLAGRYGLLDGVCVINSQVGIMPARHRQLLHELEAAIESNPPGEFPTELEVDYVLAPRRIVKARGERVQVAGLPPEIELLRLSSPTQSRDEPPVAPAELAAFYRGAWISGMSWLVLLLGMAIVRIRRKRSAGAARSTAPPSRR